MTSGEKAEPERSAISSTDVCECGHARAGHPWHAARGEGCIGNRNLCSCRMFRKTVLMCTCGHSRNWHPETNGHACTGDNCLDCAEFRCDHTRCGWKPRCTCGPDEACGDPCTPAPEDSEECPHVGSRVVERSDAPEHWTRYRCDDCGAAWSRNWSKGGEKSEEHDFVSPAHCAACMRSWLPPGAVPGCEGCGHPQHSGFCRELCMPTPGDVDECGCLDDREPPLTPEEEEMVSGYEELAEQAAKLPPQPDRRPPYLLAYSVQGHLYEVALPGDATVAALDGRLVITHQLGPVAGICQIAPITSEESTR